jgi:taurine transport system substrate-binding protein
VIGDSEALTVKKDSKIKTVANLTGNRVAAPFGSTTHYHLMLALKLANAPPEKLNLINLEPREIASSPSWPVFMRAVNPAYILKALE